MLAGNRHLESWEEVDRHDLGAQGYHHLVLLLQGLPPREARLRKVQDCATLAGAGLEDRGGRSGIGLGFGT